MTNSTLPERVHGLGIVSPERTLPPRTRDRRPSPAAPSPDLRALAARRAAINRAACAPPGPLHVVLYALTGLGMDPSADLAEARGYAEREHLVVIDQVVDTLTSRAAGGADDPMLRRGYGRVLQMLGDPASPVRGVVAVSRIAISPVDHLYEAQLIRYADRGAGLWFVRRETEI
ncbi:hypothetical protein ABT246_25645 [Streptomyces sp. NPDC001553]|uniref:hypothetical protein n=1 Tax=Streptomyces sp. NPDC001553 TaxID=3154385 RepID=UPI003319E2B6